MRRLTAARATVLLLAVPAFMTAGVSAVHAEAFDYTAGGGQEGEDVTAQAGATLITWDESRNGSGSGSGPVATTARNWSPPPCWYAPRWNPTEFGEWFEVAWDLDDFETGHSGSSAVWMWNYYDRGHPYEDFNSEEEGNGMWWGSVQNPTTSDPARSDCTALPFWVEDGETPEVENAISPEILAELAYERIRVPATEVTLSPADHSEQVVNLPTWIWAENGDFSEVAVTASLDILGISATTTARPTSLRIEAGTGDADLHPGSGECAVNADGSVGEPYVDGRSGQTPPCGVTYHRATHQTGSYPMSASVTWEISWEGSGGSGGTLPNAVFETTHDLQVREVQTIVR